MNFEIVGLTIVVIFTYGIGSLFTKSATKIIGGRIILWNAIVYSLILLSFFFIYFKNSYRQAFNSKAIIFQACATSFYAFGSIAFYFLISKRPVGIVVILSSLYPIVSVVLSYFFLKETLNFTQIIGILFALTSVILLTK